MSIESTLSILKRRFPQADVAGLQPRLNGISDLDRLKQVNLEASVVASFQSFEEYLDA